MDAPLLLYDGDCGLCHGAVRFVLRHERSPLLRFGALQSEVGRAWAARAGTGMDTLLFVEKGAALCRSDAVIAISRHLRLPWRWLGILRLVPRRWRDAGYDFVARRRMRWFGKPSCALPEPGQRERFVSGTNG